MINNKKIEDNLNEVINSVKAIINGKEYIYIQPAGYKSSCS